MKISMLFLTMNRLGVVARCFKSLAPTLHREGVEWYILDNASRDGTADWIMKLAARYPGKIHPLLYGRNTGVAGGRDILLKEANGDVLVILDSDVEAYRADWLDKLLEPLQQPDVWVAGPGGHWLRRDWLYYETAPQNWAGETDVVSGYCQAWKREAFDRGVQMDLKYNPRWHEDSDTAMQARSLGGKVWHTGAIGLRHIFSHTGDDGSGGVKQHYLISKWRGKGLTKYEKEAAAQSEMAAR